MKLRNLVWVTVFGSACGGIVTPAAAPDVAASDATQDEPALIDDARTPPSDVARDASTDVTPPRDDGTDAVDDVFDASSEEAVDALVDVASDTLLDGAPEAARDVAIEPVDAIVDATADQPRDASSDLVVDAPSDQPRDVSIDAPSDQPRDVSIDAIVDAPTDQPRDVSIDAIVDAPTDQPRDVSIDAIVDAPTDQPRDASSDAIVDAGVVDPERPPWRVGACSVWTRVPPVSAYAELAVDSEGVWLLTSGESTMMRYDGRWHRTISAGYGAPAIASIGTTLLSAPGGVFWINDAQMYQRRAGRWVEVGVPRPGAGDRALSAWSMGGDVYVPLRAGGTPTDVPIFRYDGAAWTEVTRFPGPASDVVQIWGDRTAIYVVTVSALWRFDGRAWSGVAAPSQVWAVGGPSGADAYAKADRLYHVEGAALRAVTGMDCGGGVAPSIRSIASASGRAIAVGNCGSSDRAWLLAGGTATDMGTLPASGRVWIDTDRRVWLTSATGMVWSLGASAWTSLQEVASPPFGRIVGASIDDLTIAGNGLWHFTTDRWSMVTGTAGMSITGAWRAPDGTVFFSVQAHPTSSTTNTELWRFAGGTLTRDLVVVGTTTTSAVLDGRSATEVYASIGTRSDSTAHLYRWNGSVWAATGTDPCRPLETMQFVVTGASSRAAICVRDVARYLESDGGAWTEQTRPEFYDPSPKLRAAGSPGTASAYYLGSSSVWQRVGAAWLPILAMPNDIYGPGPGPDRLIGRIGSDVGPLTGSARVRLPFAQPEAGWTDLRTFLSAAHTQTDLNPESAALARCDLP